jgi:hypothetical protein
MRGAWLQKQSISWPRLAEPRTVIQALVGQRGWRVANAEAIPHDLWAAGGLPELNLAEQLSLLLAGFKLTFEIRARDRTIVIVPIKEDAKLSAGGAAGNRPAGRPHVAKPSPKGRQVYTLRVPEQPVRVVLQLLSQRLHWTIQIDEESIRAAGKSLDTRVSLSVENADREELLQALLEPAGLDYRIEDDRVRIIPRRYSE